LDLLNTYILYLQVTIALSLIYILCNSLQHVLSLFNLLCLHQSLPADGSQRCQLLPCSRSYRLITHNYLIFLQLSSQGSLVIAAAPRCITTTLTAQKTPLPTVFLLFHASRGHYLVTSLVYRDIT
jgi:hypothetical protein